MADAEVELKFSADGSEAKGEMENLKEALNKLAEITGRADKSMAGLHDKAAEASAQVIEMRARLNELNADSPMAQQWESRMNRFASMDIRADHYASQFAEIGAELQKLDEQFVQGELSVKDYETAIKDLTKEARSNMKGITQLRAEVQASNRLLSQEGGIGQMAELYARLAKQAQELGSRNEELGMSFARSAEQMQAQAEAIDTSSASGQKQMQTLTRAAEQAQTYADRTARINGEITQLAQKMDAAAAGMTKKQSVAAAAQQMEQYALKLDQLGVKVDAVARREGAAGAVREAVAQQAAAAAAKESAAEQQAALQMEYGAMSRKQLIEVMRELIQARQAAAAAGNAEAVQNYTARIGVARTALQSMNQELNLMRVQLLQKAQMGLQAAQSLQMLGQAAVSGSADVGSMATAVTGLGYAMSAGLGPIGWAMAAIQGVASAVQWWTKVTEENRQKLEEARKTQHEVVASLREGNLNDYIAAREEASKREIESLNASVAAYRKNVEQRRQLDEETRKSHDDESQQQIAEQRKVAQEQHSLAQNIAQVREKYSGQANLAEMEAEDKRHEAVQAHLQQEAAARKVASADENIAAIERQIESLQNMTKGVKVAKIFDIKAPDFDAFRKALKDLEELKNKGDGWDKLAQLDKLRDRVEAYKEEIRAYTRRVNAADKNLGATTENVEEKVGAAGEEYQKNLDEIQKQKDSLDNAYKERRKAQEDLARVEEDTARAERERILTPTKLMGEYVADEAKTQREIAQVDLERLEAKQKELEALKKKGELSEEELRLYEENMKVLEEQRKAIRDTLERKEREKGWERAQEGTVEEQLAYAQRMLKATREGTQEWERWARESRTLANSSAMKELDRIRDRASSEEATSLNAQRKALRSQIAKLQELASRTGLSASTQEEIRKELDAAKKEAKGWRENLRKRASEGQELLKNGKAPEAEAKNNAFGGNLKSMGKDWEKTTKAIERAASKGDTKALKRLVDHLRENARKQERLTGDTGKFADAFQEVAKAAQAVLMQRDGLTPEQRQRQDNERKLNDPLNTRKRAQTLREEQQARQQELRERATQKKSPAKKGGDDAAKPQKVDMSGANEGAKQAAAVMQQIAAQSKELVGAMQQLCATAQQVAEAFKAQKAEIAKINSELGKVKRNL